MFPTNHSVKELKSHDERNVKLTFPMRDDDTFVSIFVIYGKFVNMGNRGLRETMSAKTSTFKGRKWPVTRSRGPAD